MGAGEREVLTRGMSKDASGPIGPIALNVGGEEKRKVSEPQDFPEQLAER